ncbi:hypothetical protein ACGFNX_31790 [Streptomyces sp. NPDC048723]|uniref:hypothetical protein n=1 Tax=unclassified Streptomyces TaxID=2593676 RepID=UPI000AAC750E
MSGDSAIVGNRYPAGCAGGLGKLFRFYDLRHTGNILATGIGAKLKDLMVRVVQSSERTQLIYQHSTKEHQRKLADDIDANIRSRRTPVDRGPGTSATATVHRIVPPLGAPAGAAPGGGDEQGW